MPGITFGGKTLRLLNEIESKWPERGERGMELVLLQSATNLKRLVQQLAPQILGEDYVDGLEVVFIEGDPPSAGIIHKGRTREIQDIRDEDRTVVYVVPRKKATAPTNSSHPREKSPKWVAVLHKYNPWPANLIPVLIKEEAIMVSREVSPYEVERARARIVSSSPTIERELKAAGLKGGKIKPSSKIEGGEIREDLAFAILRTEFGYGSPQRAHWRPAVKSMMREMDRIGERLKKYILTGQESAFDIEQEVTLSSSAARTLETVEFGKKIGTAVGLKG